MIEILQGTSEAYSSWSENFVNDSDHVAARGAVSVHGKDVDRQAGGQEQALDKAFGATCLWKS